MSSSPTLAKLSPTTLSVLSTATRPSNPCKHRPPPSVQAKCTSSCLLCTPKLVFRQTTTALSTYMIACKCCCSRCLCLSTTLPLSQIRADREAQSQLNHSPLLLSPQNRPAPHAPAHCFVTLLFYSFPHHPYIHSFNLICVVFGGCWAEMLGSLAFYGGVIAFLIVLKFLFTCVPHLNRSPTDACRQFGFRKVFCCPCLLYRRCCTKKAQSDTKENSDADSSDSSSSDTDEAEAEDRRRQAKLRKKRMAAVAARKREREKAEGQCCYLSFVASHIPPHAHMQLRR